MGCQLSDDLKEGIHKIVNSYPGFRLRYDWERIETEECTLQTEVCYIQPTAPFLRKILGSPSQLELAVDPLAAREGKHRIQIQIREDSAKGLADEISRYLHDNYRGKLEIIQN